MDVEINCMKGENMDPEIRGLVEKNIDRNLSSEELETICGIYKHYETFGFIRDVESAMFANIVANAQNTHARLLMWTGQDKDADFESEGKEFETIIISKGAYILSKIREVANK